MERRILQVSLRADPLSAYRGGPLGGQQVLVEMAVRALQPLGFGSDVLTTANGLQEGTVLGHMGRVVRLDGAPTGTDDEWMAALPHLIGASREWVSGQRRPYRAVHSYSWFSGVVGSELAPEAHLPWVHSPGNLPEPGASASEPETLMVRQLTEADRVVVSSSRQADRARRWAPGARVVVVPPAVDAQIFFPRDPGPVLRRLDLTRRYLLLVTGLRDDPAVSALVAEWRRRVRGKNLPPDCWMVALGPAADSLDSAADRIRAPGTTGRRAIPAYYGGAVAAILPTGSTQGLPALEAMASQVPVVAYQGSTLADLIQDGETGCLVPDGDPSALLEAALPLWDDLTLAMRLGSQAQARVMEAHTLDRLGRDLAALYLELDATPDGVVPA